MPSGTGAVSSTCTLHFLHYLFTLLRGFDCKLEYMLIDSFHDFERFVCFDNWHVESVFVVQLAVSEHVNVRVGSPIMSTEQCTNV